MEIVGGRPAFDVPQRLFPVERRFLELDGARIHYVDEGTGNTLLLLHGNPSWSFLYRKIIAALKSDFRCVALDFPGYGLSDPAPGYHFTPKEHSDVLERFVDRLGLGRADRPRLRRPPAGAGAALDHWQHVRLAACCGTAYSCLQLDHGWADWPLADVRVQLRTEGVLRTWLRTEATARSPRDVPRTLAKSGPADRCGNCSATAHPCDQLPPRSRSRV